MNSLNFMISRMTTTKTPLDIPHQNQTSKAASRCIQNANAISNWLPIPFHERCTCKQAPIAPGQCGEPFLDFRAEVERLDPAQQAKVMGSENYQLVRIGKVAWTDVVTTTRIRPFHEVVQRAKLGEWDLFALGIPHDVARATIALVQTSERRESQSKSQEAIAGLKKLGLTDEAIRDELKKRIAGQLGISGSRGEGE